MKKIVTTAATLAAATILLTACGGTKQNDGAASNLTLPGTESSTSASSEPTETTPAGPVTNNRGNIVKALGEEGGVGSTDGTADILTFAVDSITPDVPCDADYSQPGENGHLTSVALRVSTATLGDTDFFSISANDFKFIGSDGVTFDNVATIGAYSCLQDSERFTSDQLGSGQQYTGAIVLDLPEATGTLIFDPYFGQNGAWEYTF